MTASEFAENPVIAAANEKLQRGASYLSSIPLNVWRNLIMLVAAIWMCHSLASLFWTVFPTPDIPEPKNIAAPPPQASASSSSNVNVDIAALQALNLFGEVGEITSKPEEVPQGGNDIISAEETRLNIKLQGVIASSDPKHARAIIDDSKEQLLLRIDEELPRNKGVKLARVMDKKVILDNNGRYEALTLYDEKQLKGNRSANNRHRVPNRSSSNSQASRADSAPKRTTVRPEQMPKSISDIVRFSVHRENGAMVGYRIRPGRERELFDQVGLKANDVVTTVNGIRMDDPKQLKSVYQSLKSATSADLGVLRNGEELSIQISVEGG